MKKHVVFMVHGLGEQTPGETVDEFVGAATEELNLTGPVQNNTLHLAEPNAKADDILELFPCHQRRVPAAQNNEELVVAEVHWADISPAPTGVLGTALDLLRLVLGLGYIALENVQNNVVEKGSFVRFLVPLFVWFFYAIIAPLNMFLFIGAICLLADPLLVDFAQKPAQTYSLLAFLGALFVAGGHLRGKSARSYLERLMLKALSVLGALTILFVALFALNINLDFLSGISSTCAGLDKVNPVAKLSCFTGLGVFGLKASWLIVVTLLIVMLGCSLKGVRRDPWDKRSIFLAVCSAMLVLWMTITVAIWALFVKAIERFPIGASKDGVANSFPAKDIVNAGFADATETLVYGVLSLIVLTIAAIFVAIRRFVSTDQLSADDTQSLDVDKKYGRLILNPWLNLALFVSIAAFAFSAYVAFLKFKLGAPVDANDGATIGFWAQIYKSAYDFDLYIKQANGFSFLIITLIGFGILNFSSSIASVIGIARDVTTYLTRSHRTNPSEDTHGSAYIYADEIQKRFNTVVRHVIDQETPNEIARITFMTHSQGTIVASIGLRDIAFDLPVKPTLVTMGSPLTHIYGHYFKENYQFSPAASTGLLQWFNIYRKDDFVGTRVQGNGTTAVNIKVRAKGHSHYWSDKVVWKVFKARGIF